MRPEGPKIEAEGRERGWCSWGGDSKTPHQLVDLGSTASSPSRVIVLLVMLYDVFFLDMRLISVRKSKVIVFTAWKMRGRWGGE